MECMANCFGREWETWARAFSCRGSIPAANHRRCENCEKCKNHGLSKMFGSTRCGPKRSSILGPRVGSQQEGLFWGGTYGPWCPGQGSRCRGKVSPKKDFFLFFAKKVTITPVRFLVRKQFNVYYWKTMLGFVSMHIFCTLCIDIPIFLFNQSPMCVNSHRFLVPTVITRTFSNFFADWKRRKGQFSLPSHPYREIASRWAKWVHEQSFINP